MRVLILLLSLNLMAAACGRGLTENEARFLNELHGEQIDTSRIRLIRAPPVAAVTSTRAARPRTTCRERIFPPPESDTVTAATAGIVLFNRAYITPDYVVENYLAGYPDRLNLVAAMFFSHEMAHIWQWQNRRLTGYHPLRAFAEHGRTEDPYLFEIDTNPEFLDYAYEQQASLVEEYVCCRALDPHGARTGRLTQMLGAIMDLTVIDPQMSHPEVLLPWDGAPVRGICS